MEKAARSKGGEHVAGVTAAEAMHQRLAIVAVRYGKGRVAVAAPFAMRRDRAANEPSVRGIE